MRSLRAGSIGSMRAWLPSRRSTEHHSGAFSMRPLGHVRSESGAASGEKRPVLLERHLLGGHVLGRHGGSLRLVGKPERPLRLQGARRRARCGRSPLGKQEEAGQVRGAHTRLKDGGAIRRAVKANYRVRPCAGVASARSGSACGSASSAPPSGSCSGTSAAADIGRGRRREPTPAGTPAASRPRRRSPIVEPEVVEVGDVDQPGEPEVGTVEPRPPPTRAAPAKKPPPVKKAAPRRRRAGRRRRRRPKKAPAKKQAPPPGCPDDEGICPTTHRSRRSSARSCSTCRACSPTTAPPGPLLRDEALPSPTACEGEALSRSVASATCTDWMPGTTAALLHVGRHLRRRRQHLHGGGAVGGVAEVHVVDVDRRPRRARRRRRRSSPGGRRCGRRGGCGPAAGRRRGRRSS